MLVKQRLRINTIVSSVLVLSVFVVLALTAIRVNSALDAAKLADSIMVASFERLMLRTDNHRTGSERSKVQLIAKHKYIGEMLKTALTKFPAPGDRETIKELLAVHESTGKLSRSIREYREQRGSRAVFDQLFQEREDRLLSQLNMRVYETILLDSKLQAASNMSLVSALKEGAGGVACVLLLAGVVTLINSISMNRAISSRIGRLREGAAVIGSGNLDHRTCIGGDDEFAELSAAFDEMAVKLNDSYRNLKTEIEVRTRAENALRENFDGLTRLNRAMVGRELRMIELKREINELCTQAGLSPRYVVADGKAE